MADRLALSGFSQWSWLGFLIASAVAILGTLIVILGADPNQPVSNLLFPLFVINGLLISCLGVLVVRDIIKLGRSSKPGSQQGRLARRFAILFSVIAVVPALIVSVFLGVSFNRGLDRWFSDRIQTIVEGGSEIAQSNISAIAEDIRVDVGIMALDLNAAVVGYQQEPAVFRRYLQEQASFREFPGALLLDSRSNILMSTDNNTVELFVAPTAEIFETANEGNVSIRLSNEREALEALFRLEAYDDVYLYTIRPIDNQLLSSLRRAEETVVDYRLAEERGRQIQTLFFIGFVQITLLILLFSLRYSLFAAGQITRPIARLAAAADDVRRGDLSVQVPEPALQNEVLELTQSFNSMTARLRSQRDEIDSGRREAEQRSAFIVAVLEGVTAGIVRIDSEGMVRLSNRSAAQMFPAFQKLSSPNIRQVSPDLADLSAHALTQDQTIEATLVLQQDDEGERHLFVRATPDETKGGCVLTFDDTTRLISAQRQVAWKDVARRIAHEIRNPLTPIQLSAERLKRRYRKYVPEDDTIFEKCIDTVLRQVGDIGRMVEEFSSFARMPKPELEPVDLSELVLNAVFDRRLATPDVKFNVFDILDECYVEGDVRLIGQALTNILKNAAEAALRSEAEQTEPSVSISMALNENYASIDVLDTGPGFEGQNRQKFLEPYYTTRDEGVGLGLAIVNRIVEDHGGQLILLDRSDGVHGAKVTIRLPLSGPSNSPPTQDEASEEIA